MKCWWCRRERKCRECRLKYARGFVPLCENCEKGLKDKITEVKVMENTQDWETLIASRMRPCATMPKEEDASKRTKKISSDRYEKSEKRKVSRKKWQQSEAGKKSMHERGERYRHTEKGVQNSRKKAMTYYYAHKNDPEFKAKRAARQRKYRAEAKARRKEAA